MSLRNILVVHEARSIRNMLKTYILSELNDVLVTEATSALEALQKLQEKKFEVVICSKQTLAMEGTSLLKKMCTSATNQETPFIVVTSTGTEENMKELAGQGIQHCLISPFTPKDLRVKIDAACNPREWRTFDRFNIPGAKALIQLDQHTVEAEVINISIDGVLCDLTYRKEYTGFLKGMRLTIQFPSEYNHIQIKDIWCKLLRLNVLVWGVERFPIYIPEVVRAVWQFVELSDLNKKALAQVFDKFKKISTEIKS